MTASARKGTPSFLAGLVSGVLLVLIALGAWFLVPHRASRSPAVPSAKTPVGATPGPSASVAAATPPSPAPAGAAPSTQPAVTAASVATGGKQVDLNVVSCPRATVHVSSVDQLNKALGDARPGTTVQLADGVYGGNFVTSVSGTEKAPIFLCGGAGAVLDGLGTKSGYALHLNGASYWRLVGFTVRNAQKGVVLDGVRHSVVQNLTVTAIGDEGIHLRSASMYNLVSHNTVSHTGQLNRKFGEGIYIGSAKKNWKKYGVSGGPDRSDFNVIYANHISATTAECVDIKEGTTGGLLLDNVFDGRGGLTAADSWVDVKGNGWHITGNSGTTSPADGFQTHQILKGWGSGNVFRSNHSVVNGPGYGIHVTNRESNTVFCDNAAIGAGSGVTNVVCTP